MQFQVCESDDSCQPGPQYTNPRVVVEEHHGAPLLNCSGLVLMRQLIERLGVARAIDAGVRVLRRCKWYRESDHILTLIYSMLSGGSKLQDVNRLGQDDALKRVLGTTEYRTRRRSASFCGALETTSKTSSGRDWQSCGTRPRQYSRSVRDAAPGAAQGSDAGLGLVDP